MPHHDELVIVPLFMIPPEAYWLPLILLLAALIGVILAVTKTTRSRRKS